MTERFYMDRHLILFHADYFFLFTRTIPSRFMLHGIDYYGGKDNTNYETKPTSLPFYNYNKLRPNLKFRNIAYTIICSSK